MAGGDLWAGLELLLNAQALSFLLLGLLVGFVVGVLPGFQGASGAALILPFTIALPVEQALLMMAGTYAGATFAGSIPAILLNVPGTAGAAATALDGYPMAQRGEAEKAIGIARTSSALGGVLGVVLIISSIGWFSSLALSFGSREIFVVAVLGLLLIGSLIGSDARKGVLAGLLGVLVSMVSASPLTGQPRVTFGFVELYQEVPFVPVLIGLFAYSQLFVLATQRTLLGDPQTADRVAARRAPSGVRGALAGVTETFRHPRTLLRSSVIGTVVGVIPGTGSVVANFVSYGAAKRASKQPEEFGKGAAEGVVASEAADNGVTAGTLVPTLTLGIPGSASAAIMMGALLLHGVQPGPQVMQTHGPAAYSVLLGLLVASIAIMPLGVLLAAPLASVLRVPLPLLVPVVLLFSTVGVYAVRSSMFDVGLALLFGVSGLFMVRHDYPVVPVVLGLILGPLAERNLIRALSVGQDSVVYFLGSTQAKILWGAVLLLLVSGFVRRWRRRRQTPVDEGHSDERSTADETDVVQR